MGDTSSGLSSTVVSLIGHGLDDPNWAARMAVALGHAPATEQYAATDPESVLGEKLGGPGVPPELIEQLQDTALYHAVRTVLHLVGDVPTEIIG